MNDQRHAARDGIRDSKLDACAEQYEQRITERDPAQEKQTPKEATEKIARKLKAIYTFTLDTLTEQYGHGAPNPVQKEPTSKEKEAPARKAIYIQETALAKKARRVLNYAPNVHFLSQHLGYVLRTPTQYLENSGNGELAELLIMNIHRGKIHCLRPDGQECQLPNASALGSSNASLYRYDQAAVMAKEQGRVFDYNPAFRYAQKDQGVLLRIHMTSKHIISHGHHEVSSEQREVVIVHVRRNSVHCIDEQNNAVVLHNLPVWNERYA